MKPVFAEIRSKLCTYERDYLQYTKCLCRGIELLLSGKPEEVVRQVFLYFLIHESELFPNTISVRTEHNNLDIAIYKPPTEEQFRPRQAPVVIVEVKREDAYLPDHKDQLFRYMKEQRTSVGILFNGNEVIVYEKGTEGVSKKGQLDSLSELRDLLKCVLCRDEVDLCEFQCARDGDVDSFIYLASKYGKYTVHQFKFTLKNTLMLITGCCFQVQGQRIYYDIYGKYGPKKRFSFDRCEFERLISMIY